MSNKTRVIKYVELPQEALDHLAMMAVREFNNIVSPDLAMTPVAMWHTIDERNRIIWRAIVLTVLNEANNLV